VAVDQEQDTVVVVGRSAETPDTDIAVVPVIRRVEGARACKDVGQGAIAKLLDLLVGERSSP
jgi:hypothetical protein